MAKTTTRDIARIALPFAGVAIGWYLFMPNFEWLRIQEQYRSQAAIDLMRIQNKLAKLHYQLFTPKAVRDWNACVLKSGWDFLDAQLHKNESGDFVTEEWTKKQLLKDTRKRNAGQSRCQKTDLPTFPITPSGQSLSMNACCIIGSAKLV